MRIEQMKNVDIRTVDPESLVSKRQINTVYKNISSLG